ncbi:MAG: hypothetical protein JWP35_1581 [Caulobacter sp.]|nr:hypothetical protein [Caulobacter sp.]
MFVLKVAVALTPVVVALLLFDHFDMFDLVSFRSLVFYLILGAIAAAAAYNVNGHVLDGLPIGRSNYSRYMAPMVEEALKASILIALFAFNRIGFKLDAAVIGFAVGAGFSILENIFYLHTYPHANLTIWIVRGLGTAIMHGGSASLFAVITHEFTERQAGGRAGAYRFNPLLYIPGLVVAAAIHGTFNQFPDAPLLAMMGALLLIPMTLFLVFARSEKATHLWLTADFETHAHALEEIRSGRFAASESGRQIARLAKGFRKASAGDIFDYIGALTERIMRAEQVLLEREAGRDGGVGEPDRQAFARLHELEARIGRAVLRALRPHLNFSRNDLWEMGKLEEMAGGRKGRR